LQQQNFVLEVKELLVVDHNDMMKKSMLEMFELNLYFLVNEMVVEYYENLITFVFDLILVIIVEELLNDLMMMLMQQSISLLNYFLKN
jgi:hypothetical protein